MLPDVFDFKNLFNTDSLAAIRQYPYHYRYDTSKDGETTIELPVPGFSKDDINVKAEKDKIIVSAKGDWGKDNWKHDFEYVFRVENNDSEKTVAKLEDGLLKVTVFKSEKAVKNIAIS